MVSGRFALNAIEAGLDLAIPAETGAWLKGGYGARNIRNAKGQFQNPGLNFSLPRESSYPVSHLNQTLPNSYSSYSPINSFLKPKKSILSRTGTTIASGAIGGLMGTMSAGLTGNDPFQGAIFGSMSGAFLGFNSRNINKTVYKTMRMSGYSSSIAKSSTKLASKLSIPIASGLGGGILFAGSSKNKSSGLNNSRGQRI